MILGLIPAAGLSSRMGRSKLALPLGGKTVLEHVISALQEAGVRELLVVVAPETQELERLAQGAGANVFSLPGQTPTMRDTVEMGLRRLEELFSPRDTDSWLLVPGDHPTLNQTVIRQLLNAKENSIGRSIIIPTYLGRRGHPALIDWKHVAKIKSFPPERGLNAYLRGHVAETYEVNVDTEEILWDLDTPEDYERLLKKWQGSSA